MKPRLIEDLGLQKPTEESNYKKHYGIYVCPQCNNPYRTMVKYVDNGSSTKCKLCHHKHRRIKTRLYRIWSGMRSRTLIKTNKDYPRYGGRGITFCKEWDDFDKFREWSNSNGYKDTLSIDRIDNDSGYSPDNCQWITGSKNSSKDQCERDNKGKYIKKVYNKKEA